MHGPALAGRGFYLAKKIAQSQNARELLRSLERMEADLAELRAEVERMRAKLAGARSEISRRS